MTMQEKAHRLPEEALEQLRGTLDTYDRIRAKASSLNPGCDKEMTALRETLRKAPEMLGWSDISQAQQCVVDLLSDEQVRADLPAWRRRFAEVAGPTRYAQYLATACDLSDPRTTSASIRADVVECVRAIYYFYAAYGIAARSRSAVTKSLMRVALGVLGVEAILGLLLTLHYAPNKPMIALHPESMRTVLEYLLGTSAAAVVGSVVSVQRRLQDPSVEVDPTYRYIQTTADWFGTAFVSPIFAAVFGLLMYGLLASKLLSSTLMQFNDAFIPNLGNDVAVLLVLGFAAGFAEQLVPDALTRIAARALGSVASSPLPVTGSQTPTQRSAAGELVTQPGATTPSQNGSKGSAHTLAVVLRLTPEAAALGQDSTLASEPNVQEHDERDTHDANS